MIEVVFCCNDVYVKRMLVTLYSMMINTSSSVHVSILQSDFTQRTKNDLLAIVNSFEGQLKIDFVDIDPKNVTQFIPPASYISKETFYRYFIPEKIQADRCIYLDGDMLFVGDINELWMATIENKWLGGVKDIGAYSLGYLDDTPLFTHQDLYINAGMLLINIAEIKKENKIHLLQEKHLEISKQIRLADQDVVNFACKGKIQALDERFNLTTYAFKYSPLPKKDIVLVHFTGPRKPWKIEKGLKKILSRIKSIYNKKEKRFLEYKNQWLKVRKEISEKFLIEME